MRFFAPLNLLWLLPLVPVIVFFYLLKLKRREVVVSSVLLWNHLVKDVQANAPFQKLKKNLLLLLQLLIAFFCIFALARPAFFTQSLGGSHVVVVLDGSASMQSRDVRGSRFDQARTTALKMIGDMRGGDRMMLLLATSRTHRLTGFTSDKNELRRAVSRAEAADTSTNLRDALLLAVSAGGSAAAGSAPHATGSRVYVLSDGAFAEMDELDTRGSEVQFVKFGTSSNNVGLVAMDVRRTFKEEGGYQMFVAVRNYAPEPKKCNLEFYRNEALIDVRPVELPAADRTNGYSEKAEVYNTLPETTGILRARLDINDDLPTDNEAYSQLSTRQDINVLLVTDGNLYLEKALNVDPHVKLSVSTPTAYNGQSGFDVVVFENEPPRTVGPGAHLYVNCGGPTAPVEIKGKITQATILDWERVHPVMRYVKLNQLHLAEALTAEKRPWGVTLAEHEEGTVIAVGEKGGVKSGYVGFPLLKSDFALRVAFPIFFNNMVQWLAARPGKTEGVQLRTGQTAPIEIPPSLTEVTLTDPVGKKHRVKPEGKVLYYSDTEKRGIYTVEGKGFKQEFAVNLLSREESATMPQDKIQLGRRPLLAGTGTTRTASEVWRWLLLLAVVILGIEWWVYHKRI
jgi:VWA domain-containing protein/aerotolerance regulator-like protein